jgi:hypothetical protein
MDDLTRVEGDGSCDNCGGGHATAHRDTDTGFAMCGRCAERSSGKAAGLALGGWNTRRLAMSLLGEAGVSDEQIHEAINAAREHPTHRDEHAILVDLDAVGLPLSLRGTFDDDTRFVPLEGGER